MARYKKILISLPDNLLNEADNLAYEQNVNRSEFIREAMKMYIQQKTQLELTNEEMAEINLELSNYCLSADNRQQQSYEDKLAECE